MDTSGLGRQLRPGEQGGTGIGKTEVGKGGTVMVVAAGQGVPIRLHVDSAQPPESTRAETTAASVTVPCRRGRPRTRPKELSAARADESQALRRSWRRRGSKPTMPPCARGPRQRPKRGRPLRPGPHDRHRWKIERGFGGMENYRRLVVRYQRFVDHLWWVNLILK